MRSSLIIPIFLILLLLSPLPTTALPAVFSAGLNLLLSQSRSFLITAARTQAAAAFFQGLDETKTCLSEERRSRTAKDTANCWIGPLRTISGAYLFTSDLNRWFFGAAKNAKNTAAKQATWFVTRAAAAVYLLKSDVGTWMRDPETWRKARVRVKHAFKATTVAATRFGERTRCFGWKVRRSKAMLWMHDSAGKFKRSRNFGWLFGDARSKKYMTRRVADASTRVKKESKRGNLLVRKTIRDARRRWQGFKRRR